MLNSSNANTMTSNGGCHGNTSSSSGEQLTSGGEALGPPAAAIGAAIVGGLLALCLLACAARYLLRCKKSKGGNAVSTRAARRIGGTKAPAAHSHSMVEIGISQIGTASSSARPPPPPADTMPTWASPRATAMLGATTPGRSKNGRGTVACKPLSRGPEVKATPQWLIDAMRSESDPEIADSRFV